MRRRRGIGLVRRGRDRVRGGAASNDVFGVDRLASWRADGATLHSVLEAGRRGLAAVFSPRKHPMVLLAAFLGRVGAAASPAASATHTKWPLSAGAWFAHVGARIGTSSALFSRKFKTAHARQLCQGCPPCQYASHLWCEASGARQRDERQILSGTQPHCVLQDAVGSKVTSVPITRSSAYAVAGSTQHGS